VLGRLERTGPIVWGLPSSANLTIRQLGLLLFLATTGLASGQAFASQAFTVLGLKIVITAASCVVVSAALMIIAARLAGASPTRTAGAIAGFIGQPAILAYANGRVSDERVDAGYSALFAICMITKILIVQIIVGL
jgi:putative transport protein